MNLETIVDLSRNWAAPLIAYYALKENMGGAGLGGRRDPLGARVIRIGVNDRFSHACGSYDYLLKEHKFDKGSVLERLCVKLKRF